MGYEVDLVGAEEGGAGVVSFDGVSVGSDLNENLLEDKVS